MAEESPTMEGLETPPEPVVETDGLLKELEALNITEPKQIADIVSASQQTGRAWNEVGELRNQVADLQRQVAEKPAQNMGFEDEPVDIRGVVKNAVREFYVDEIVTPQKNATANYYNELASIQNDPDYGNETIQAMWNKYAATPNFQMKIQSGESTMGKEYDKLVRTYYREVINRSHKTIKGLTARTGGGTPFVEGSDTRSVVDPTPIDERKETAQKIDKKRRDGTVSSDGALRDLVNTFLPQQDPIWRQE